MARPVSVIRSANFLGLDDDLAAQIGETQASTLENVIKVRKKLVRRGGQTALGAAVVSPDQDLNCLEYAKMRGIEHLLSVHNTNVVDFLHATPGTTITGGASRFTTSADCNVAWIEDQSFIGNGYEQNVRYNGAIATDDAGVQLTAASSQSLVNTTSTLIQIGNYDFTGCCWVYSDAFGGVNRDIMTLWDISTAGLFGFTLHYASGTNRFTVTMYDNPVWDRTATAANAPSTATWYFLAFRYVASTGIVTLHVNAETPVTATGSGTSTGGTQPLNPSQVPFRIGAVDNSGAPWASSFWNGRIDQVGFWQSVPGSGGALSNAQLLAIYNGGRGLRYPDLPASLKTTLVDWWELNETSGNRVGSHNAIVLTALNTPATATGITLTNAVAQVMVDPANSRLMTATQSTAGNLTQLGVYKYKISHLSADGFPGEASESLTVTLTGSNDDVTLSAIPTCPSGQDCTGRRIWRTKAGGGTYFKVADIGDNTTTTYLDTTADTSLSEELIEGNVRFPPCRYLIEHQSRMIGAWNEAEDDLKTVYISNFQEPHYCPILPDLDDPAQGTRAVVQGRGAGEITGLCSHGAVVAVFTGGVGYLLRGVEPNDFRLQKFADHGCAAHRTIVSVRDFLIWLSWDGVYLWDGSKAVNISDAVYNTIAGITAADMAKAHAYIYNDKYYLCWPSGAIFFDLEYKIWGKYTNWLWRDSTVTVNTASALPKVYGAYYGHSRVYQLETGATDSIPSASTAIPVRWASKDWDMGLPGREKRVHLLDVRFKKGTGTATIKLYRGTGDLVLTDTQNIATVDDADYGLCVYQDGAPEAARSEFFRLEITHESAAATEFELLAAGLQYSQAT